MSFVEHAPTESGDAARRAFIERNRTRREMSKAKSVAEATAIINAQTRELHEAATYNERVNAEFAELKARFAAAMPELRKKLYAPLWMIPAARTDWSEPVPNTLWLATSIALIVAGVLVMVL